MSLGDLPGRSGSRVSECVSSVEELTCLFDSLDFSGPGECRIDRRDLALCFRDVVGPWASRDTWFEIIFRGPAVFKRRADHRLMVLKSLLHSHASGKVSRYLAEILDAGRLSVDQILENDIGRILVECDMFILDIQTSDCHICSPYMRSKLRALADDWAAPRSFGSRIKRFIGF